MKAVIKIIVDNTAKCAAIFILFLAGCMVGPNFRVPCAPSTKTYTPFPQPIKTVRANNQNAGKAQFFVMGQDIPAEWWYLFHCPTLNNLIEMGLVNSPTLDSAKASLKQANELLLAQIGGTMLPAINSQFAGERQKFSNDSIGQQSASNNLFNVFNVGVNVSYTLDIFGGARREIESLCAQVNYQHFLLEGAYLTLTTNIVTAAVTQASLQAQIDATQAIILSQEEQLNILKKQFQLGGVSMSDVLAQETQLALTRATLPPLQQKLEQTRHALAVYVGILPSDLPKIVFDLNAFNLPALLPLSIPSRLVQQRPDIRASQALLHAANAQVGVATANLFPQFNITGSYGWSNSSVDHFFAGTNNIWSYGATLLQPVFNGGALIAKWRASIAAFEQARAQYRQTVLQAFQNVADTLRALENDAKSLQINQQAENAAAKTLKITEKQLRLGGVSYLSLLNAQRQYQQARINRIQAQASRYTDTAALFQSLGGGWWNRTSIPKVRIVHSTQQKWSSNK